MVGANVITHTNLLTPSWVPREDETLYRHEQRLHGVGAPSNKVSQPARKPLISHSAHHNSPFFEEISQCLDFRQCLQCKNQNVSKLPFKNLHSDRCLPIYLIRLRKCLNLPNFYIPHSLPFSQPEGMRRIYVIHQALGYWCRARPVGMLCIYVFHQPLGYRC